MMRTMLAVLLLCATLTPAHAQDNKPISDRLARAALSASTAALLTGLLNALDAHAFAPDVGASPEPADARALSWARERARFTLGLSENGEDDNLFPHSSLWFSSDTRGHRSNGKDGDVNGIGYGLYFGTDTTVGDWRLGGAVAYNQVNGEASGTLPKDMPVQDADVTTWVAGLYPYARWSPHERAHLWFLMGAGAGPLGVSGGGAPSPYEAVLAQHLYALGARWDMLHFGRARLALKTDGAAFFAHSVLADGITRDMKMFELIEQRWRAGLETGYDYHGRTHIVRPQLQLGVRIDFASAAAPTDEPVLSGELGGGLSYEYTPARLTLDARGQYLLASEIQNTEEWNVSLTARVAPDLFGRGIVVVFEPSIGTTPQLRAEIGYGIRRQRVLLTPLTQYSFAEDAHTVGLGTRLAIADLHLELLGERSTRHAYALRFAAGLQI